MSELNMYEQIGLMWPVINDGVLHRELDSGIDYATGYVMACREYEKSSSNNLRDSVNQIVNERRLKGVSDEQIAGFMDATADIMKAESQALLDSGAN